MEAKAKVSQSMPRPLRLVPCCPVSCLHLPTAESDIIDRSVKAKGISTEFQPIPSEPFACERMIVK